MSHINLIKQLRFNPVSPLYGKPKEMVNTQNFPMARAQALVTALIKINNKHRSMPGINERSSASDDHSSIEEVEIVRQRKQMLLGSIEQSLREEERKEEEDKERPDDNVMHLCPLLQGTSLKFLHRNKILKQLDQGRRKFISNQASCKFEVEHKAILLDVLPIKSLLRA